MTRCPPRSTPHATPLPATTLSRSVLIGEKTGQVGGTTSRSGGVMWIPNNPIMKRDGIVDSDERAATYLDAVLGDAVDAPGATPARRRAYLREAPRMIDFLLRRGIRLTDRKSTRLNSSH